MKGFGVTVSDVSPAKLPGFDLVIRPRPNLIRSDRAVVFGSLMAVTHDDLTTIYSGLEKNFGIRYLPEAVLAMTQDGSGICQAACSMCAVDGASGVVCGPRGVV
jgi:hypothetical protein